MALGDGIRRNIASVSPEERQRFVDAIKELNQQRFFPGSRADFPAGGVSYWFKQDEIHQATHVHGFPAFLPWHRELCNRFEALLRQVDPDLSLHYWDWNTDPDSLFTADFMGSASGDAGEPWLSAGFYDPTPSGDNFRDDSVHDNPFDPVWEGSYSLHSNPADPPQNLTRNKQAGAPGVGQSSGGFFWPTDTQLVNAATFQEFNDLMQGCEMGTSNNCAHGLAHGYIGGTIGNAHTAFRDPFVFLIHSNVDRLWAMWQTQPGHLERLDPNQVYGTDDFAGSLIRDSLQPWAGTSDWPVRPWYTPENQQVVKSCKHSSVVRPPCYDTLSNVPATVTRETLTINFNDVPEGETTVRAAVFVVNACDEVNFEITDGPTLLTGPPETVFDTPLGVTTDSETPTSANPTPSARLWISYTGTNDGDAATGTVTIHCAETNEDFVIPISANTIARPSVAVVLVLDKSNSMNFNSGIAALPHRIDVLKYSAPPFVDVIQEGNAIGIVSFDHDAYDVMAVTAPLGPPPTPNNPFADLNRVNAKNAIAAHSPNPLGNTSIGDAVELAHQRLQDAAGFDHRAMIVFTDGHETAAKYISEVADIDDRVFAIALGTAEEIQPNALTALCNGHEGFLRISGPVDDDDFFRLTKYYLQILAGVTNEDIVKDPEGWLKPGDVHRIPFFLNEADIGSDVILLTPAPNAIRFALETPNGQLVDPAIAAVTPGMLYALGSNVSYHRMTLPVVVNGEGAREGLWHAVLGIDKVYFKRYLASLDNYPAALAAARAHGLRYSLNVHSYSNLRMRAGLTQNSFEPGATLLLRAVLTEYGLPVERRATVQADLERPDHTKVTLTLAEVEPGVFETSVAALMSGVYTFLVRAAGVTLRQRNFTREQIVTGAVWRGGDAPPPTSKDDPRQRDEQLCRLLECLFSKETLGECFAKYDIDLERVSRCIRAFCKERTGRVSLHDPIFPTIPGLSGLLGQPGADEIIARLTEIIRKQ